MVGPRAGRDPDVCALAPVGELSLHIGGGGDVGRVERAAAQGSPSAVVREHFGHCLDSNADRNDLRFGQIHGRLQRHFLQLRVLLCTVVDALVRVADSSSAALTPSSRLLEGDGPAFGSGLVGGVGDAVDFEAVRVKQGDGTAVVARGLGALADGPHAGDVQTPPSRGEY